MGFIAFLWEVTAQLKKAGGTIFLTTSLSTSQVSSAVPWSTCLKMGSCEPIFQFHMFMNPFIPAQSSSVQEPLKHLLLKILKSLNPSYSPFLGFPFILEGFDHNKQWSRPRIKLRWFLSHFHCWHSSGLEAAHLSHWCLRRTNPINEPSFIHKHCKQLPTGTFGQKLHISENIFFFFVCVVV